MSVLDELQSRISESESAMMNILVLNLSITTEMEPDEVARQLSEPFGPDDLLMFGPRSVLDHHRAASHSKESLSFDEDVPSNLIDDDATSEASVSDLCRFIPKIPSSPSVSHIISIGKLLESALEVAGQVAGTSVSTSPLSYDSMTRHRCKYRLPSVTVSGAAVPWQTSCKSEVDGEELKQKTSTEQYLPMKLPPASPYDNFLKAAGC
ncbi:unnamed protein product [Linum trigynum]|uniref:Uncharacterized protein n=1 Tax=Linum trigynum TaxID=586398 RepID=A0AAV2F6Z1_9ROSI